MARVQAAASHESDVNGAELASAIEETLSQSHATAVQQWEAASVAAAAQMMETQRLQAPDFEPDRVHIGRLTERWRSKAEEVLLHLVRMLCVLDFPFELKAAECFTQSKGDNPCGFGWNSPFRNCIVRCGLCSQRHDRFVICFFKSVPAVPRPNNG